MKRVALAALVLLCLAGCSQVAAIAPVGGLHFSEVRFATADILVAQGVEILEGPDCTQDAGAVSCTGSTVDGDTISSESPASDPTLLTVTVGSTQLYSGTIQDALDAAVRPAS